MKTDTDFFLELLRRGEILTCEDGPTGWVSRMKIDDKQYVLTLSRCHDISDTWEYVVVDTQGNQVSEGWYTRAVTQ